MPSQFTDPLKNEDHKGNLNGQTNAMIAKMDQMDAEMGRDTVPGKGSAKSS